MMDGFEVNRRDSEEDVDHLSSIIIITIIYRPSIRLTVVNQVSTSYLEYMYLCSPESRLA